MIDTDEDIVSGLLTAFHRFSLVEFQQELESIEMAGLKWIYKIDPDYSLIFVAADSKDNKTEILTGRLLIIKKTFTEMFKDLFVKRGNSWDGNLNVFSPFLDTLEDYYSQWEEVNTLNQLAEVYDVLRVFQQIIIILGNLVDNRMYRKIRSRVLKEIEFNYKKLVSNPRFLTKLDMNNFDFTINSWFEISDLNLVIPNKSVLIEFLKALLVIILDAFRKVKGDEACFKYFYEEKIFQYIYRNMYMLKELNLDMFFLKNFLLL